MKEISSQIECSLVLEISLKSLPSSSLSASDAAGVGMWWRKLWEVGEDQSSSPREVWGPPPHFNDNLYILTNDILGFLLRFLS